MPPCLFSQGADMATKEQNLKRLDELALILGREPDISGSAAEIAQRVAEWEEEIQSSGEDVQVEQMFANVHVLKYVAKRPGCLSPK